ncbi:MAG: hypothetical protein JSS07_00115 [Proteobacteria bacterium]|nr:hypothetical protein [Pseudomonadota bacterium]
MQPLKVVLLIILTCLPTYLFAQTQELKIAENLKEGLKQAINNKEYYEISNFFHPNAFVILEDTPIFHSLDEFKQFLKSPGAFERLKVNHVTVNQINIDSKINRLDGKAFIISGTAGYVLHQVRGKQLEVPIKWIATITNEQDKWLIASYQETMNVFDNPIIEQMRYDFYMICFLALIIGFIIGFTWKKLMRVGKNT